MEQKKYNVFHELILSIYKIDAYKAFIKNKSGKTFLYGLILAVIQYIIFIATVAIAMNAVFSAAVEFIEESCPEFTISNGVLAMDNVVEKDIDGMYFYIDTNQNFYLDDLTYFNDDYSFVLLADSQKILLSNNGEMQMFEFEDLDFGSPITKDSIINIMPIIKNAILIICSLAIIILIGLVFWSALWHSLFMMIINAATKAKLSFSELYKISLHACTLPIAISALISLFSLAIPFWGMIKFIIIMLYGYFAIKAISQERAVEALNIENSQQSGLNDNYFDEVQNNQNNQMNNDYFGNQNNSSEEKNN